MEPHEEAPQFENHDAHVVEKAKSIRDNLELPNWAPWLQGTLEEFIENEEVFPEGQLVVTGEQGLPIGSLMSTRINWNGQLDTLPTWDDVADDESFADSFTANGNTLTLISMSVAPGHKGERIPERLIGQLQELAATNGIEHIIGDFRPSGFGEYKRRTGDVDFAKYVGLTREDGLPEDPWLRNLTRQGMKPLALDYRAMAIPATLEELREYQTSYHPENWYPVTDPAARETLIATHDPTRDLAACDEIWECGETGTWYVDTKSGQAVYIESNYCGELPVTAQ